MAPQPPVAIASGNNQEGKGNEVEATAQVVVLFELRSPFHSYSAGRRRRPGRDEGGVAELWALLYQIDLDPSGRGILR